MQLTSSLSAQITLVLIVCNYGVVSLFAPPKELQCEDYSCNSCYNSLVRHVVYSDKNMFNLSRVFFPPLEEIQPSFVVVHYKYNNGSIESQKWYWSQQPTFLLQPAKTFQFTSLLFGTPSYSSSEVTVTLPDECANASTEYMEMLTQRLKLYTTAQEPTPSLSDINLAKGASLSTIDQLHQKSPYHLLVAIFQYIVPFFVTIFTWLPIIAHIEGITNWLIGLGVPYDEVQNTLFKAGKYRMEEDGDSDSECVIEQSKHKGESIKRTIKTEARVVSVIVTSTAFIIYIVSMDIAAVVFLTINVPGAKDFEHYTYNLEYPQLTILWHLPIVVMVMDTLGGLLLILVTFCALFLKFERWCKYTLRSKYRKLHFFLAASLGCVVLCVSTHLLHVILAFIVDSYHATSVWIYYIASIVIYHILLKNTYKYARRKYWNYHPLATVPLLFLVGIILASLQVITIYMFISIPINRAIDAVANRANIIFQNIIAVMTTFIAYKIWYNLTHRRKKPPADIALQEEGGDGGGCGEEEPDILENDFEDPTNADFVEIDLNVVV